MDELSGAAVEERRDFIMARCQQAVTVICDSAWTGDGTGDIGKPMYEILDKYGAYGLFQACHVFVSYAASALGFPADEVAEETTMVMMDSDGNVVDPDQYPQVAAEVWATRFLLAALRGDQAMTEALFTSSNDVHVAAGRVTALATKAALIVMDHLEQEARKGELTAKPRKGWHRR